MEVLIDGWGVLEGCGERLTSTGSRERIPLHELPLIAYYAEQLAHFAVESSRAEQGAQPDQTYLRKIADEARAVLDIDWYEACDYLNIPLREWNLTTNFDSIPDELMAQLGNGKAHLGMILKLEGIEYVLISATLKDGSLHRPNSEGPHEMLSVAEATNFITDAGEQAQLANILAILNDSRVTTGS